MGKQLLISFIIGLAAVIYYKWATTPTQYAPYPYKFQQEAPIINNSAPIAIIGDRMGARLELYKDMLGRELSANLVKPIEIDVFAKDQFALHRSINQLKRLKKFPRVIIYHGASQEEVEYRFITQEIATIQKNFEFFQDPKLKTLLTLFPWFSKFMYRQVNMLTLDPNKVSLDSNDYTMAQELARRELTIQMYRAQLEELIELSRQNSSLLILVTTPLNPDVPPRETCSVTMNEETQKSIEKLNQLIKRQDYKTAYQEALLLKYTSMGNAKVFYLFQKIAQSIGRNNEAKEAHDFVTAYDCEAWRSSSLYNQAMRLAADENDIILYDFDLYIKSQWGKNLLFFDEIYPQDLYYQKMITSLGQMLKRSLNL